MCYVIFVCTVTIQKICKTVADDFLYSQKPQLSILRAQKIEKTGSKSEKTKNSIFELVSVQIVRNASGGSEISDS